MIDAVEYVKEKVRMCHADPIEKFKCDRCPMFADTVEIGCVYWEETDPAEAVRIVEDWSKAHPIRTNGQKFVEVFGFDPWRVVTGDEESWDIVFNDNLTQLNFWRSPYEEPKGADK